jgi:hypothetical protein
MAKPAESKSPPINAEARADTALLLARFFGTTAEL